MRLDTQPGEKVRFTGEGGYTHENTTARRALTVGDTYTVTKLHVGGWHSVVYLEGHTSPFNTVMFENVEAE
jgi:hypothetical protein